MSLFAFLALGVSARRSVARAFEMHIPLSPFSAATQHELLAITREISKWSCRLPIANRRLLRIRLRTFDIERYVFFFFRRPNDRPERNFHDFVRASASAHFLPHPVPALFRFDQRLIEEIGEIINV